MRNIYSKRRLEGIDIFTIIMLCVLIACGIFNLVYSFQTNTQPESTTPQITIVNDIKEVNGRLLEVNEDNIAVIEDYENNVWKVQKLMLSSYDCLNLQIDTKGTEDTTDDEIIGIAIADRGAFAPAETEGNTNGSV